MGKGGGGSESVTMRLDPETQRYVEQYLRPAARSGASAIRQAGPLFQGPNAGQVAALRGIGNIQPGAGFDQFMNLSGQLAGNLGQAFDPSSIQSFMDPFRSDVVAGAQGIFSEQRDRARTAAAQQATQAGAFGGARSALLEAQAVGDVNRQESQLIPQILSGGYTQALNAALGQHQQQQQLGQFGLGNLLAGTQFGTGLDFQRQQALFSGNELFRQLAERRAQEPIFRNQQIVNMLGAGIGPYGQNQSASSGGGNPLAGAFGGALTGLGVGGPVGALVGGGLGLLGGIFG